MHRFVFLGLALVGCSGGGTCEDACEKMAACLGFSADGGAENGWQCPLGGDVCDPQKKCFARCNLEATCEEIKEPNKPSAYRTCREACTMKHFGQDGGAVDRAIQPGDGEPPGDLVGPFWQCSYQSELLLGGCVFSWSCPSGEDRELKCQQDGATQSCTCKNKNKGTTEATFSAQGICSELPSVEVTSQANKSCGWKIQEEKD